MPPPARRQTVRATRRAAPAGACARVEFHGQIRALKRARTLPIRAPASRRRFRQRLLAWYRRHGRDLPWRKTDDPYHILVSEIMLQQTQVDRVLPKYAEWLEKYPPPHALAAPPQGDVPQTRRPPGHQIRPQRPHSIARAPRPRD